MRISVVLTVIFFVQIPSYRPVSGKNPYFARKYPWLYEDSMEYMPELSSLPDMWYKKQYDVPDDLPFLKNIFVIDSDFENNAIDDYSDAGTVKKRDYTAAQLLGALKQLARSRGRHRQIRIAGKGLRFGISKK